MAPTMHSSTTATTIVVFELSPDPWLVEKSLPLEGIACLALNWEAVNSSSRAVPPLEASMEREAILKEMITYAYWQECQIMLLTGKYISYHTIRTYLWYRWRSSDADIALSVMFNPYVSKNYWKILPCLFQCLFPRVMGILARSYYAEMRLLFTTSNDRSALSSHSRTSCRWRFTYKESKILTPIPTAFCSFTSHFFQSGDQNGCGSQSSSDTTDNNQRRRCEKKIIIIKWLRARARLPAGGNVTRRVTGTGIQYR